MFWRRHEVKELEGKLASLSRSKELFAKICKWESKVKIPGFECKTM
jgi:hypothetical protein